MNPPLEVFVIGGNVTATSVTQQPMESETTHGCAQLFFNKYNKEAVSKCVSFQNHPCEKRYVCSTELSLLKSVSKPLLETSVYFVYLFNFFNTFYSLCALFHLETSFTEMSVKHVHVLLLYSLICKTSKLEYLNAYHTQTYRILRILAQGLTFPWIQGGKVLSSQ